MKAKHPKPETVGNARVPLYHYQNEKNGEVYHEFKVPYKDNGRRKFYTFATEDDARTKANEIATRLDSGTGHMIAFSNADRETLGHVKKMMRDAGCDLPLSEVVETFIAMRKVLGKTPPLTAAQYFADRHGANLAEKPIRGLVTEMVLEKEQTLSKRHVDDLENRLARFAKDFQCPLHTITGPQVRDWLSKLTGVKGHQRKDAKPKPLSPRSRNNYLLAIQNLVSFAKGKGYLPKQWDALEDVETFKERDQDVQTFAPDEVARLLSHANEKLLPFIALSAFAGIRSAELERLDWSKIDMAEGHITIDASIAKTNSRRVIPMADNLKAWLQPLAKKSGRVCPYGNVTNELVKLATAAGVVWKRNGLRHSFGSYRTAQTSDIPRVSYEMGNSPAMVRQHYLKLSTEKQAAAWFNVRPAGTVQNVVAMASGE